MSDWYDKLISLLGLDPIRRDVLFGTPLHSFPEWTFRRSAGTARPSLCQLPDGRTQLVFELRCVDTPWVGFIPASARNLTAVEDFLGQVDAATVAERGTQWPRKVVMAPLPDRNLDSVVELAWDASHAGGARLEFTIRGPRGYLRQELDWTPALAADWKELLAQARARSTPWPSGGKN